MFGTISSLKGKEDDMESVLARMVEAAREETGVEVYSYHRGEDNTFWFFALMSDEETMKNHGQSPAMQAAMEAFAPLMAAPPQVHTTRPIAGVGLDL